MPSQLNDKDKYFKSDYSYELPEDLIAKYPCNQRDSSKLLVLERQKKLIQHKRFFDLPEFLDDQCILVINDTKVFPARLPGEKLTGGKVEALLIDEVELGLWRCKVKNAARVKNGEQLIFCNGRIRANLVKKNQNGECLLQFQNSEQSKKQIDNFGYAPLPPYILKARNAKGDRKKDLSDYQTIFANKSGSIAAPTAGLHFTSQILETLKNKGVDILHLTLHVGAGTFEPIRTEDFRHHKMHFETYEISTEVAEKITAAKKTGKKVIAVGTTTVRTLESAWEKGKLRAGIGSTNLFIYPPYSFQIVEGIITNFHLPESSLLMLISAFAGRENVLAAYSEAVKEKYRFFSFGDCMLIQ